MADITRAELYALGLRAAALANVSTTDQDTELEATTATGRAYLRKRYQGAALAAAIVDPAYKSALARIATHRLLSTRGYRPGDAADEAALLNHNASLTFLRDVSKNLADLDVPTTEADGFAHVLDPGDGVGILSDEPRE